MQNVVSCNLQGNLAEQLFQLANIYNYSTKHNKTIIIRNDCYINDELKHLLKNKINIMNKNDFNKIHFKFHIENDEIPYCSNNLYITGSFINNDNYTENTRLFISNLFINNNKYYNEAIGIINNIKTYFNNYNDDNYIIMYYNYTNYLDNDITYYNNAYEKLNGKHKNIIVLSNNVIDCKNHLSINKNFYFIENSNECVYLLLMLLIPNVIGCNLYLSWWGAYISDKTTIMPVIYKNLKINNCLYI